MDLIAFKRLNSTPLEFSVTSEHALFNGTLVLKKYNIAELNGTITGTISLPCDQCAQTVEKPLDEEVSFYLSDGIIHGNENDLDVVEIENSMINLDDLMTSELELIKGDYFCCPACEGKSVDYEL